MNNNSSPPTSWLKLWVYFSLSHPDGFLSLTARIYQLCRLPSHCIKLYQPCLYFMRLTVGLPQILC